MSQPPPDPSQPRSTAPPAPEDPTLVNSLRRHGPGRIVFGRFRLVRELGAGGMAVVWLANDERLGLEVALKFLPGMVASDPDALHDLRAEITRGLRLTHPGVVRVYDLHEDSDDGLAAIAMEYVDGPTLSDEKARQPGRCFDVAEPLLTWTRELCDVLGYVHEKAKVVHRDLKPRNLMLTAAGELKVADFGIAATLSDSHSRITQGIGSSGTPAYMSPQQALGRSPRAADDVYALGATLYELLTSKPPFFRGSVAVILNQVASEIPPTLAERRAEFGITGRAPIPQEWEETIAACLAKDPAARPANVREVAQRLAMSAPMSPARASAAPPALAPIIRVSQTHDGDDAETVPTAASPRADQRDSPPPTVAPLPPSAAPARRRWVLVACAIALPLLLAAAWQLREPNNEVVQPKPTAAPQNSSKPAEARQAEQPAPFENSLGMKFVPVPITAGSNAGQRVLFSVWDTRVQDYAAFAAATKRVVERPEYPQEPNHPVVKVNWEDAVAFCEWLSQKEGRTYRLPTDHEWSCAAGIGDQEDAAQPPVQKRGKLRSYPWGEQFPPPQDFGNYYSSLERDSHEYTSPAGSFPANRFGLHDMSGNVWQWCQDLFDPSETNGSHVLRGGSFESADEFDLRTSARAISVPSIPAEDCGFRCVLVESVAPPRTRASHAEQSSKKQTPGPNVATTPQAAFRTHVVNRNDTLVAIGRKYGVTASEIMKLNKIDDPLSIRIGQVLKIPPPRPTAQ